MLRSISTHHEYAFGTSNKYSARVNSTQHVKKIPVTAQIGRLSILVSARMDSSYTDKSVFPADYDVEHGLLNI